MNEKHVGFGRAGAYDSCLQQDIEGANAAVGVDRSFENRVHAGLVDGEVRRCQGCSHVAALHQKPLAL